MLSSRRVWSENHLLRDVWSNISNTIHRVRNQSTLGLCQYYSDCRYEYGMLPILLVQGINVALKSSKVKRHSCPDGLPNAGLSHQNLLWYIAKSWRLIFIPTFLCQCSRQNSQWINTKWLGVTQQYAAFYSVYVGWYLCTWSIMYYKQNAVDSPTRNTQFKKKTKTKTKQKKPRENNNNNNNNNNKTEKRRVSLVW